MCRNTVGDTAIECTVWHVTNGNQSDIVSKLSKRFSAIGLPYKKDEIDRVHCIGRPYENESLGLIVKSIIIKFWSLRCRQDVYRNRPSRFENDKKTLGFDKMKV